MISDEVPLDEANDAKGVAQRNRNQAIQAAQGSAWGVFALEGEVAHAVTPDISNAGDKIAYVSTDQSPNGHPSYDASRADIYTVPFNARKGGSVTPLSGAADSQAYEYYPSFSADDELIAFTRAPNKGGCPKCPDGPYYNRFGEINVIPAAGGTRTPLLANQPVQCAGDNADIGLINSWPKWSPSALKVDGKTYYFLIFSSGRKHDGQFAITAIDEYAVDARRRQRRGRAFVAALHGRRGGGRSRCHHLVPRSLPVESESRGRRRHRNHDPVERPDSGLGRVQDPTGRDHHRVK